MKPTSHHHSFSDDDPTLDEFFEIREMAPNDFATRTVEAVRVRRRRARVYRFTAWTTAVAATVAIVLGVGALWTPNADFSQTANAPTESETVQPSVFAVSNAVTDPGVPGPAYFNPGLTTSAEELTALLYAAIEESDTMFYGHAWELERLLADAIAISDEETLQTLDMLFLLAQY